MPTATTTPTPEPLTDERLAAIEARCAAATPGPWTYRRGRAWYRGDGAGRVWTDDEPAAEGRVASDVDDFVGPGIDTGCGCCQGSHLFESGPDGYFIAAARADVPDLVAEVRRLQELVGADVPTAWTRGYYAGRLAGWDLANTGTPRSAILTGEDAEGDDDG